MTSLLVGPNTQEGDCGGKTAGGRRLQWKQKGRRNRRDGHARRSYEKEVLCAALTTCHPSSVHFGGAFRMPPASYRRSRPTAD